MRPRLLDHGIEPVEPAFWRLGALDNLVLWASLSVGLLVLVTGSLLVPALGLADAFLAILLGSLLGGLILGAIAWLGATTRVPGMVLLRAPLGVHGSFAASALNVAQNFGWTVFEVIVIAKAAHAAAGGPVTLWKLVATAVVTALAAAGPLAVVRRVLRVVGVPIVIAAGAYLTIWSFTRLHWHAAAQGRGGLTFWLGVDLAIAIPISWAPLVADYARFARSARAALLGTAVGTTFANGWFYMLGAAAALIGAADPRYGLKPVVGVFVLGMLALAETDKPFADLYSTVVSIQNVRPRWPALLLAGVVGVAVATVALAVSLTDYESFLLLLGSCFVPLAGVLLGHALRLRGYAAADLHAPERRFGSVNLWGIAAWVAGFAVYQWLAPTPVRDWQRFVAWLESHLAVPAPPAALAHVGASVPSFLIAAALAVVVARLPAFRGRPSDVETVAVAE